MKRVLIISLVFISIFLISGIGGCAPTASTSSTEKICMEINYTNAKDFCLAIIKNQPSLCHGDEQCILDVTKTYKSDFCAEKEGTFQYYCYSAAAQLTGDSSLCDKIGSGNYYDSPVKASSDRIICKAVLNQDVTLCGELDYCANTQTEDGKINCMADSNAIRRCYAEVGKQTKDIAICKESTDIACTFNAIVASADVSLCEGLDELKESCKSEIAFNTNDISFCGTNNLCLALGQKNPDLCNTLSEYESAICYDKIASYTKNPALCKNLQGFNQDICYWHIAGSLARPADFEILKARLGSIQ